MERAPGGRTLGEGRDRNGRCDSSHGASVHLGGTSRHSMRESRPQLVGPPARDGNRRPGPVRRRWLAVSVTRAYTPREYADRRHDSPSAALPPNAAVPSTEVQLPVEGMSCASCVNRIERFLRKTPGVAEASVNLATEVATVRYLPEVAGLDELVRAIEAAGYEVRHLPAVADGTRTDLVEEADAEAAERAREERSLGPFRGRRARRGRGDDGPDVPAERAVWPWSSSPGCSSVPPRSSSSGRDGASTGRPGGQRGMAPRAWIRSSWSAPARPGDTASSSPSRPTSSDRPASSPRPTSTARPRSSGLILMGRWLEARAKGRTVGAIKALLGLQARSARIVRCGREVDVPLEEVRVGDLVRVRPGERVPVDGRVTEGRLGGRRIHAHRRAAAGREGAGRRGDRRDHEPPRHVPLPGDAGRARHGPGPDRGHGAAGSGEQGADPASGRPDRRHLRARRPGRGCGHVRRSGSRSDRNRG